MHPCCCWASVRRKCNSIHFRIHPSVSCHIINKNWWPRAIASHTDPCNLYIMVWYIYLLGSCVFFSTKLDAVGFTFSFFFLTIIFFKSWKGFHDHPLLLFSVSSFTNLMNQWTNEPICWYSSLFDLCCYCCCCYYGLCHFHKISFMVLQPQHPNMAQLQTVHRFLIYE